MNRAYVVAILLCATQAISGEPVIPDAGDVARNDSEEELQLKIGNRVVDAPLDTPIKLNTPKGEEFDVTLRRRPLLAYKSDEVSFIYPRELKLTDKIQDNYSWIELKSEGLSFDITVVEPSKAQKMKDEFLKEMRKALKRRKLGIKDTAPIVRTFGQHEITGDELEATSNDSECKFQAFVIPGKKRSVLILIALGKKDAESSERKLSLIAESMKLELGK